MFDDKRNSFISGQRFWNLWSNFHKLSHLTSVCSNNSGWSQLAFSRCARNNRLWRDLAWMEQASCVATSMMSFMLSIVAHNRIGVLCRGNKGSRRKRCPPWTWQWIHLSDQLLQGHHLGWLTPVWTQEAGFSQRFWNTEKCSLPECILSWAVLLAALNSELNPGPSFCTAPVLKHCTTVPSSRA